MRLLSFAGLVLLLGVSRAAAQEVAVRVRAIHEGEGVGQAQVSLGDRRLPTTDSGEAWFRVPPGRYALRIERIGFESFADSISLTAGQDTTLMIELEAAAVEADEVIVESTRGDRRIQDEPTKVEVVTREEWKKSC